MPSQLSSVPRLPSPSPSLLSTLFVLLLFLLLPYETQAANPIKIPIIKNAAYVHTRQFAQLPRESRRPAKIVSIVSRARDLYICTLTNIYRINRSGKVYKFLDVQAAIRKATNRELSIANPVHGGVRSIAFHPTFFQTGLFYVSAMETRPKNPRKFWYISDVSNPIDADSVLLEFQFNRTLNSVNITSYRNVFRVGMPVYDHTIRQILFRFKYLYIAHGDGSEQAATVSGGQNNDARGKILRINPLKPSSGRRPYSIPQTNPFINSKRQKAETWALGFRNPHNMCFGKDGTLYVADTGRSNVEEINLVRKGRNYGWSLREGTFVHKGGRLIFGLRPLPSDDAKLNLDYPNAQVGHEGPKGSGFIGQAIAGACPVENGSPMNGKYWYGDFPKSGRLFFSGISDLKKARTRGDPKLLTQARTKEAVVCLETGSGTKRRTKRVGTLGGAVRATKRWRRAERVDIRFGRGGRGELYWSSKTDGKIYVMTSSLKGGPSEKC